ncbi:MAG: methyltransferase domain-containing protein [Candidatus Bathyarchaeota archaeon]|nr:MAG: methyltransferase domain-containing protein [Candidatus Bathyarchaeota archaeon]
MVEWDQILLNKDYHLEYPDEMVVSLASILEERRAERVLDLGCGAGRHLLYLAENGFEAYGADISKTGLTLTRKRLESMRLEAEIKRCDMKSMPYINSCFDAVICVRTIYHQRLKDIQLTISEIHRVLRRRGLLLANFHSKRSSRYGTGIRAEEDTFIHEDGPEKGILHHFFNEEEIRELLMNFEVNLEAREKKIGAYLQSLLIVLAEKT